MAFGTQNMRIHFTLAMGIAQSACTDDLVDDFSPSTLDHAAAGYSAISIRSPDTQIQVSSFRHWAFRTAMAMSVKMEIAYTVA
jgi:hypothetical protein